MKEMTAGETTGVRIGTKPRSSTGLCALFAAVMILSGNVALMIPGLIFALAALIVVFAIQDKTCARINAKEIILFQEDPETEVVIPFGEIAEWNTQSGIQIRTLDGLVYLIDTHDTMTAHRALRRHLPELETSAIRQRQIRQRKPRKSRRPFL